MVAVVRSEPGEPVVKFKGTTCPCCDKRELHVLIDRRGGRTKPIGHIFATFFGMLEEEGILEQLTPKSSQHDLDCND